MLRALWFCELDVFQEFISSTKRPYAKELETVDFKDKLEETKGQINSSVKELTDGKYPLMFCQQLSKEVSLLKNACFKPKNIEHLEASLGNFSAQAKFFARQAMSTTPVSGHFLYQLITWQIICFFFACFALLYDKLPHALVGAPLFSLYYGFWQVTKSGLKVLKWEDDPWIYFQLKIFTALSKLKKNPNRFRQMQM